MAITKDSIKNINADLRAAIEAVAKKHNLSIAKTNISYNNDGFRFTGEFGDIDSLGDFNPLLVKDLKKHGFFNGLHTALGKEFTLNARTYEIQGMKGHGFVIGKLKTDGKLYKLRTDDVVAVLRATKEIA